MEDETAAGGQVDHEIIDRRRFRIPDGGMTAEDLSVATSLCKQEWAMGRIGTIPIVPPGGGGPTAAEYDVEVEIDIHIRPRQH